MQCPCTVGEIKKCALMSPPGERSLFHLPIDKAVAVMQNFTASHLLYSTVIHFGWSDMMSTVKNQQKAIYFVAGA